MNLRTRILNGSVGHRLLAVLALAFAFGSAATAATPFTCSNNLYLVQGNSTVTLSTINIASKTLTPIGSATSTLYNGIGFRPQDGFIWGSDGNTKNQIVQVDSTGTVTVLSLTGNITLTNSGDVNPATGLYYNGGGNGTTLYEINVAASPNPALLRTLTLSQKIGFDLAFSPVNGSAYTMNNGALYSFAIPASGTAVTVSGPLLTSGVALPTGDTYGAAFFDQSGIFYPYDNKGTLYRVDVRTSPATVSVAASGLPNVSNNDGAWCGVAPNMTKDASPRAIAPGANTTYTFTINNLLAATNVQFTDTLPTGLTFVPGTISPTTVAGGTPALSGGNVTLTIPGMTLAAQTNYTFTIQALAAATAAGNYPNQANLSGTIYGGNINVSAVSSDPTLLAPYQPTVISVASPNLGITKTSNGPWLVGQSGATYTLTVTNTGTTATTGTITVLDTLPAGITVAAGTYNGWTCTAAVSCTRSTAISSGGGTSTITLPVTVGAAAAGSVTNYASVGGGGDPNNGGSAPSPGSCVGGDPHCASTTTAVNLPQLTVTKSASPNAFSVGGTGTYTLTVGNLGTSSTAGAITVTDALPSGITTTAMPSGTGWNCAASTATNVSCTTNAVVAIGGSASLISVPVAIAVGTTSPAVNTAAASGGGDSTCPGAAHCLDQISTPILTPSLQVTKASNGPWVVNQAGATYTLTVMNAGTAATTGVVTVDDTLPGGITANWAGTLTSGVWSCTFAGQAVTCTGTPNLAASGTSAITLPVNVTVAAVPVGSGPSASVVNNASVGGGGDPFDGGNAPAPGSSCTTLDPANPGHCASNTTTVNALTDVSIVKSQATPNPVVPGQSLTWTITVTNATGPSEASAVTTTDTVPAAVTGLSLGGADAGSCGIAGQTVSCAFGTLTVGVTKTYTISGTLDPAFASANLSNTATVATTTPDSNPGNNTSTSTTPAVASADMVAGISLPGSAAAGSTVNGSFTCTNNGPSVAASATCAVGGLPGGATVNCVPTPPVASLAVGSAISCTISFVAPGSGPVVATATAGSTTPDPNTGNNQAQATVNITPVANLSITKVASPNGTYVPGQGLSYTIVVSNGGPSDVTGATVSDAMPAALTGVTWTCVGAGGGTCMGSGSGNIADTVTIPSSGSVTYTVNATVALSATGSIANTATASSPVPSNTCATAPCLSSATATNTNSGAVQLTIVKSATPSAFAVGSTGTYSLMVSNTGTTSTAGVITVTDALPSGITATATPSGSGWDCSASTATNVSCTTSAVLLPGGNAPVINVAVAIANGTSSSVTNTANVTGGGDGTCPGAGHCSSQISTPVNAPSMTVTKTLTGNLVVGVQTDYVITATNNGQAATLAGTLTDTIPAGLIIGTLPGGCTSTGGQGISCVVPAALGNGSSVTYTIPVTPSNTSGGSAQNNTATAGSNTGDASCPGASHCNGTVTGTVQSPQLSLTKSATPATFVVNQAATYTLTVTNTGTAATTDVTTIADTIPGGLTIGTLPGGCTSTGGQGIACTVAAGLAINTPVSFAIPVTPTNALNGMSVTNTAGATGGGDPGCATGTPIGSLPSRCVGTVTTPVNAPQLTLTKTASGTFAVGVGGSYTLTVTNTGTADTDGSMITVTDVVPASLTLGTLPGGCTAVGQQVTCTTSTVVTAAAGPNHTVSFTIPVTPMASAAPSVSNTATVQGGGDPTCPMTGNCTSTITTAVSAPQLQVTKASNGPWVVNQAGATYTLTVMNAGTAATTGVVTVDDTLPGGITANWAGTLTSGVWSCTFAGQAVTCTGTPNLAASGTSAITLPVNVTVAAVPVGSGPSASVVNNASVGGGGDPFDGGNAPAPGSSCTTLDPANPGHCASNTTTVNEPMLEVTKTATPNLFIVGQAASYTIIVTNTGTATTTATTTVTDTIPTGLAIGTLTGTCSAAGQTVTCTIPTGMGIGVGNAVSFTIPVTPTASAANGDNSATATGGGDPTCTGAPACTGTVTVPVNSASLGVSKTSNGPWVVNQNSPAPTYTLTVTNSGTAATTSTVTVDDTLPNGITAPAAFTDGTWSCGSSGQNVTCTSSAALAATNGTSQIAVPVTVGAAAVGNVTNNASVGGGGDPYNGGMPPAPGSCMPGDVHCGSTTTAVDVPDLTIRKTGPANATAGGSIAYTIVVSNTGNADATDAMLDDPTPSGLTFVAATAPCASGFPCALGTVAAGASETVTVNYSVGANATGTIVNTATVSSDQTAQTSSSASTLVSPAVKPVPSPALDLRGLLLMALTMLAAGAYRQRRERGIPRR